MLSLLAHVGAPVQPHDLWGRWALDPLLLLLVLLAVWLYRRGRRAGPGRAGGPVDHVAARRSVCFHAGLLVAVVALVSPLDAAAGALASAHMVQHVLLTLVAAPLLALSVPSGALLRGLPRRARAATTRTLHTLHVRPWGPKVLGQPAVALVVFVVAIWTWHARVPYEAALRVPALHAVEHATFVVTGVLVWRAVLVPRRATGSSPGGGVLIVFALAMQGVLLSALLTFAQQPWYAAYATSTAAWGLTPLGDQRLAGVIMWVPGGLVHLGVALALLVRWIRSGDRDGATVTDTGAATRGHGVRA